MHISEQEWWEGSLGGLRFAEDVQDNEEQVTRSNTMWAGERVNIYDTPMQFCEQKVVQGVRSSR